MKFSHYIALTLSMAATALCSEKPNIVFIFADDHALQAISAYGGPLKEIAATPNF